MITKIFGDKKLSIEPLSAKDLKHAREYADLINSLVEDDAKISKNSRLTVKEEADWLKGTIKKIKERNYVFVIAKDEKKIVGSSGVELKKSREKHVGVFGIIIRDGYRGIGLGECLMGEALRLASKNLAGLKIIRLEVMVNNKPAIGLYKKMGFKIVAKVPKQHQYKGKLIGEYIMIKEIK